jgi:hypothetical protein
MFLGLVIEAILVRARMELPLAVYREIAEDIESVPDPEQYRPCWGQ